MATENEIIFKVNTSDAVQSVADLKENISLLKDKLKEGNLSFEEMRKTSQDLKTNQEALRNAMSSVNSTFDEVMKQTKGVGDTYNALSKQMSLLKKQSKEIDVSTKEGQESFRRVSKQIETLNDKLKSMDALQGNFQRNVGMYTNKIKSLGSNFEALAGSAGSAINPIKGVTTGLQVMSKTPVIAVLGILANLLAKIIGGLKTSEENANATAKAFSFLSGGADIVKKTMQLLGKAVAGVGEWLEKIAVKIIPRLAKATELRNKITEKEIALAKEQREAIRQNADDELELAKLREMASNKEKYSAKERVEALKKANDLAIRISERNVSIAKNEYEIAELQAKTAGNSREENDKLAQAYAKVKEAEKERYTLGLTLNRQLNSALKELRAQQAEVGDSTEGLTAVQDAWLAKMDETIAKTKEQTKALADEMKAFNDLAVVQEKETLDEIDALWEDHFGNVLAEKQKEVALQEARKDALYGLADATAGILSSIADMYDANGEAEGKSAEKAKALRVATATIDTIAGAISAYMSCLDSYPAPLNTIMGAVQAGAVTASGMANIAKIKSVNTTGGATSGSVSFSTASVSAPSVSTDIPLVRNATTATEEQRLNDRFSQRVYILSSDIEASQNSRRTQIAESSF